MRSCLIQLQKGTGEKQIICFPYLGGYANSFATLVHLLDDKYDIWAVNPPGHANSDRKLEQDLDSLLELYYEDVKQIIKPDCIFFGYSMGGVVAYALLHYMVMKNCEISPQMLILSASGAPHEFKNKVYSDMNDEALIAHIVAYGGIPDEILEEEDFMKYLLPIFRADYKILESAAQKEYFPLKIPVYLLWGERDEIEPLNLVLKWCGFFQNQIQMLPIKNGRHMFLHHQPQVVAQRLREIIVNQQR